jgi:adenine-specific DNA-methyltransferase
MLSHIKNLILGNLGANTKPKVLDGFCGSTRVSQMLSNYYPSAQIYACDISEWSEVIARTFLLTTKPTSHFLPIIQELNQIQPKKGWFFENYGNPNYKQPFQVHNLQKLDAIRDRIDEMNLDFQDKCVVLCSLLFALDKVDNTLGHYSSYLNKWSKRSYSDLILDLPKYTQKSEENKNKVFKSNVFDVLADNSFDVVYFDPPYGSNNDKMPSSRVRYNSYYHFWKTVVLHDKPELFGKANRRFDSKDDTISVFEEYKKDENGNFLVASKIYDLINKSNSPVIILSYGSMGRLSKNDFASNSNLIN